MKRAASMRPPRQSIVALILLLVLGVGLLDYETGRVNCSVFYLAAVALAAWNVSGWFGVAVAACSVVTWLVADWSSGAMAAPPAILVWNGVITLMVYLVVVWLLVRLKEGRQMLEERVRQRTLALTEQMAERARLEGEILAIAEREERRIGHDLHDGLCQHLAATAMAVHVLTDKLAARRIPEAADARRIQKLVEQGTLTARRMARGLAPFEAGRADLLEALRELAISSSENLQIVCDVAAEEAAAPIRNPAVVVHLYRIAQEAISNAVRHGEASRITIRLAENADGYLLSIEDNGKGMAPASLRNARGMGMRIMQHRAGVIGGRLSAAGSAGGAGAVLRCEFPRQAAPEETNPKQTAAGNSAAAQPIPIHACHG